MFITFNIDKNFFYISFFIFIFLISSYLEINITNKNIEFFSYVFETLVFFIIYIIEKILSKRRIKIKRIKVIEKNKKLSYDKIFIIIFLFIFYFKFLYLHNFKILKNSVLNKSCQLYFALFIDYICFKKEKYSHQILSLIIYLIITVLLFLFNKQLNLSILFIIESSFAYSFTVLLLKYINRAYFISVYLLGSLLGLLDMIYIIIFEDINFNNLNFTYKDLFYIIGMIIISYLFIFILNKSSSVHSIVI